MLAERAPTMSSLVPFSLFLCVRAPWSDRQICAPCLREYPDLFRLAPISSDLFRFVFRTNQTKSGRPLSADPFCKSPKIVARNQRKLFWYKVFRQPFGSWMSAPKIVDVRTTKCVFLRQRWWEKLFDPWASGRKGQECPREIRTKKFMFMSFFLP